MRVYGVLLFLSLLVGAQGDLEIGKSREGRPITASRVGAEGKPRLLVVAGLRPDHRVGTRVAEGLIPRLTELAAEDPELAACLERTSLTVIPLVNPDGLAAGLRTNTRPVDKDRDGLTDEDGPEDLNGDGRITEMRIPDPAAKDGWRVVPEGIDDDGDGKYNEDGPGGVDLDRNFAHGFKLHDPETGTSSPSEPETRALIEHVLASPEIACVLVYTDRDNLLTVPAANKAKDRRPPDGPLPGDRGWWEEVSKAYQEITGLKEGQADRADGAFHQWAYYQRGLPAFATALVPPDKTKKEEGSPDWKPFEHPVIGTVEIRTTDPSARFDPADEDLPALIDRQARFVARLLKMLPRPRWTGLSVRPLADRVYEVKGSLVREGSLPLISEMARKARATLPVRVTIDPGAGLLLAGEKRRLVEEPDKGATFRWVVKASPGTPLTLTAVSERGGTAVAELEVPK